MTLHDALSRASAFHREGRFAEAETAYRDILQQWPNQFDALHLLGVLTLQTGDPAGGIAWIDKALAERTDVPMAHKHRGMGLEALGRDDEALACYEKAVTINPGYAEAWASHGHILQKQQIDEAALRSLDKALELRPGQLTAAADRAVVLHRLRRYAHAVEAYDQVLAIDPNNAEALAKQGAALNELGEYERAVDRYDRALARDPNNSDTHYNRGIALYHLQRYPEALVSCDRAIALKPDYANAHANRGSTLFKLERYEEAIATCDAAIAFQPRHAQTHLARGLALHALGADQAALASYEEALDAESDYPEAHYNRGIALIHLGRPEDGLREYDRALALRPDYTDAMLSKAHVLLLLGRLEEGWRCYEWRKRSTEPAGDRTFPQPLWLGEQPIAGMHLFVHWEQGFGDIVQMCRYASIVRDTGANVTLSVPMRLLPLMRGFDRRIPVIGGLSVPPSFDFHCPLMSLPLALGTTVETIPAQPRYLSADAESVAQWKTRLGPDPRPKIGLVWRGNPSRNYNRIRSIPLPDLLTLLDNGRRWFCLQHELGDDDKNLLRRDGRIEFLGDAIKDTGETAALMENLDAIVSIDTFFAHLAGAMGKPLFLPLAYASDWRWLLDRQDSPWYPSTRLFRQKTMGDWPSVLRDIGAALPTMR